MRAGVVDSVLRRPGDTDDAVFARARKLGFAGVEVALGRADLRGRRPEALRGARDTNGLELPSLVLGEHNQNGGIADRDPAVARGAADDVRAAVSTAVELGADVVLVPFFLRGELVGEDAVDRCANAFRELCAEAAGTGVTLCYEGTLPARDVLALAERVASPAFGCYFDLANPLYDGLDSPTEIRKLRQLVRRVHFKDIRVRRGDCRPGLGRVDFAESAHALAEVGYDDWLVLETPAGPPEVVARDLSFARTVFPALEPAVRWPRFGGFTHELGGAEPSGIEGVQLSRAQLEEWVADPAPRAGVDGLGAYKNLIAVDPRERRESIRFVARCLELAPRLGTSVVATHAGTRHPTEEWDDALENRGPEAWALLLDAVEELLPVAEQAGSVLALEGSVKSVLRTVGQVIELFDRFPTPHLGLVCDPYNYVSSHLLPAQARVLNEFLDRFEHRFVVAHLKDVDPGGAEVATPAFGTGVFDQRPYVEFLATRRPDLTLVLEHLTPEQIPVAQRLVLAAGPVQLR